MSKIKMVLTTLIIMSFFTNSYAYGSGKPLFQSSNTSSQEFKQYLATHQDYTSAAELIESDLYLASLFQNLRLQFLEAQKAYLEGNTTNALTLFQKIVEKAQSQDWHEEDREVFFYSSLRLAQLASDPVEKKLRIEWAIKFSPDLNPDENVFDPGLIATFDQVRKTLSRDAIHIPLENFKGFDWIKINSKKYNLPSEEEIRLLPGTHRVTFTSSTYEFVVRDFTASQLSVFNPPKVPMISGDCANPVFNGPEKFRSEFAVLFESNCVYPPRNSMSNLSVQPGTEIAFHQVKKPMFKNKWTWIGLGVLTAVVVGALIISNQNKSQSTVQNQSPASHSEDSSKPSQTQPQPSQPTPTHKQGF